MIGKATTHLLGQYVRNLVRAPAFVSYLAGGDFCQSNFLAGESSVANDLHCSIVYKHIINTYICITITQFLNHFTPKA